MSQSSSAWSKINEKESFIGVIYSKIVILEGTLTSHLTASRQEHTRHMGICSILKDLGGRGFFHNSFQSLNTLTSGNSSLNLTYRPPPAVNTHFRFFSVLGWRTAGLHSLYANPPSVTESHGGIPTLFFSTCSNQVFAPNCDLFIFVFSCILFISISFLWIIK